jgi:hypothetical protein
MNDATKIQFEAKVRAARRWLEKKEGFSLSGEALTHLCTLVSEVERRALCSILLGAKEETQRLAGDDPCVDLIKLGHSALVEAVRAQLFLLLLQGIEQTEEESTITTFESFVTEAIEHTMDLDTQMNVLGSSIMHLVKKDRSK